MWSWPSVLWIFTTSAPEWKFAERTNLGSAKKLIFKSFRLMASNQIGEIRSDHNHSIALPGDNEITHVIGSSDCCGLIQISRLSTRSFTLRSDVILKKIISKP
jgi:hypothetical protein